MSKNSNFKSCETCVHGRRLKNGTHVLCLNSLDVMLCVEECKKHLHINDSYLNHLKPHEQDDFKKMMLNHEPKMSIVELTAFFNGYNKILRPNLNLF